MSVDGWLGLDSAKEGRKQAYAVCTCCCVLSGLTYTLMAAGYGACIPRSCARRRPHAWGVGLTPSAETKRWHCGDPRKYPQVPTQQEGRDQVYYPSCRLAPPVSVEQPTYPSSPLTRCAHAALLTRSRRARRMGCDSPQRRGAVRLCSDDSAARGRSERRVGRGPADVERREGHRRRRVRRAAPPAPGRCRSHSKARRGRIAGRHRQRLGGDR